MTNTSLMRKLVVSLILLMPVLIENARAQTPLALAKAESRETSMSVQVFVYLFDRQRCDSSVLPAYRNFKENSDVGPLVQLLREALPQIDTLPNGQGLTSRNVRVYEEYIDILTGKEYYSSKGNKPQPGSGTTPEDMRSFIDNSVAPGLVGIFCFPHTMELRPEQSMSHQELVNYLYSQSRWIEDHFTFAKEPSGPLPEIKIGDWSRFFSREEILKFDAELSQIERPINQEILDEGFDNLRELVHTAASDSKFEILMVSF